MLKLGSEVMKLLNSDPSDMLDLSSQSSVTSRDTSAELSDSTVSKVVESPQNVELRARYLFDCVDDYLSPLRRRLTALNWRVFIDGDRPHVLKMTHDVISGEMLVCMDGNNLQPVFHKSFFCESEDCAKFELFGRSINISGKHIETSQFFSVWKYSFFIDSCLVLLLEVTNRAKGYRHWKVSTTTGTSDVNVVFDRRSRLTYINGERLLRKNYTVCEGGGSIKYLFESSEFQVIFKNKANEEDDNGDGPVNFSDDDEIEYAYDAMLKVDGRPCKEVLPVTVRRLFCNVANAQEKKWKKEEKTRQIELRKLAFIEAKKRAAECATVHDNAPSDRLRDDFRRNRDLFLKFPNLRSWHPIALEDDESAQALWGIGEDDFGACDPHAEELRRKLKKEAEARGGMSLLIPTKKKETGKKHNDSKSKELDSKNDDPRQWTLQLLETKRFIGGQLVSISVSIRGNDPSSSQTKLFFHLTVTKTLRKYEVGITRKNLIEFLNPSLTTNEINGENFLVRIMKEQNVKNVNNINLKKIRSQAKKNKVREALQCRILRKKRQWMVALLDTKSQHAKWELLHCMCDMLTLCASREDRRRKRAYFQRLSVDFIYHPPKEWTDYPIVLKEKEEGKKTKQFKKSSKASTFEETKFEKPEGKVLEEISSSISTSRPSTYGGDVYNEEENVVDDPDRLDIFRTIKSIGSGTDDGTTETYKLFVRRNPPKTPGGYPNFLQGSGLLIRARDENLRLFKTKLSRSRLLEVIETSTNPKYPKNCKLLPLNSEFQVKLIEKIVPKPPKRNDFVHGWHINLITIGQHIASAAQFAKHASNAAHDASLIAEKWATKVAVRMILAHVTSFFELKMSSDDTRKKELLLVTPSERKRERVRAALERKNKFKKEFTPKPGKGTKFEAWGAFSGRKRSSHLAPLETLHINLNPIYKSRCIANMNEMTDRTRTDMEKNETLKMFLHGLDESEYLKNQRTIIDNLDKSGTIGKFEKDEKWTFAHLFFFDGGNEILGNSNLNENYEKPQSILLESRRIINGREMSVRLEIASNAFLTPSSHNVMESFTILSKIEPFHNSIDAKKARHLAKEYNQFIDENALIIHVNPIEIENEKDNVALIHRPSTASSLGSKSKLVDRPISRGVSKKWPQKLYVTRRDILAALAHFHCLDADIAAANPYDLREEREEAARFTSITDPPPALPFGPCAPELRQLICHLRNPNERVQFLEQSVLFDLLTQRESWNDARKKELVLQYWSPDIPRQGPTRSNSPSRGSSRYRSNTAPRRPQSVLRNMSIEVSEYGIIEENIDEINDENANREIILWKGKRKLPTVLSLSRSVSISPRKKKSSESNEKQNFKEKNEVDAITAIVSKTKDNYVRKKQREILNDYDVKICLEEEGVGTGINIFATDDTMRTFQLTLSQGFLQLVFLQNIVRPITRVILYDEAIEAKKKKLRNEAKKKGFARSAHADRIKSVIIETKIEKGGEGIGPLLAMEKTKDINEEEHQLFLSQIRIPKFDEEKIIDSRDMEIRVNESIGKESKEIEDLRELSMNGDKEASSELEIMLKEREVMKEKLIEKLHNDDQAEIVRARARWQRRVDRANVAYLQALVHNASNAVSLLLTTEEHLFLALPGCERELSNVIPTKKKMMEKKYIEKIQNLRKNGFQRILDHIVLKPEDDDHRKIKLSTRSIGLPERQHGDTDDNTLLQKDEKKGQGVKKEEQNIVMVGEKKHSRDGEEKEKDDVSIGEEKKDGGDGKEKKEYDLSIGEEEKDSGDGEEKNLDDLSVREAKKDSREGEKKKEDVENKNLDAPSKRIKEDILIRKKRIQSRSTGRQSRSPNIRRAQSRSPERQSRSPNIRRAQSRSPERQSRNPNIRRAQSTSPERQSRSLNIRRTPSKSPGREIRKAQSKSPERQMSSPRKKRARGATIVRQQSSIVVDVKKEDELSSSNIRRSQSSIIPERLDLTPKQRRDKAREEKLRRKFEREKNRKEMKIIAKEKAKLAHKYAKEASHAAKVFSLQALQHVCSAANIGASNQALTACNAASQFSSLCEKVIALVDTTTLVVGQSIEARYQGKSLWFPAVIERVHGDSKFYDVHYKDGDKEKMVARYLLRPLSSREISKDEDTIISKTNEIVNTASQDQSQSQSLSKYQKQLAKRQAESKRKKSVRTQLNYQIRQFNTKSVNDAKALRLRKKKASEALRAKRLAQLSKARAAMRIEKEKEKKKELQREKVRVAAEEAKTVVSELVKSNGEEKKEQIVNEDVEKVVQEKIIENNVEEKKKKNMKRTSASKAAKNAAVAAFHALHWSQKRCNLFFLVVAKPTVARAALIALCASKHAKQMSALADDIVLRCTPPLPNTTSTTRYESIGVNIIEVQLKMPLRCRIEFSVGCTNKSAWSERMTDIAGTSDTPRFMKDAHFLETIDKKFNKVSDILRIKLFAIERIQNDNKVQYKEYLAGIGGTVVPGYNHGNIIEEKIFSEKFSKFENSEEKKRENKFQKFDETSNQYRISMDNSIISELCRIPRKFERSRMREWHPGNLVVKIPIYNPEEALACESLASNLYVSKNEIISAANSIEIGKVKNKYDMERKLMEETFHEKMNFISEEKKLYEKNSIELFNVHVPKLLCSSTDFEKHFRKEKRENKKIYEGNTSKEKNRRQLIAFGLKVNREEIELNEKKEKLDKNATVGYITLHIYGEKVSKAMYLREEQELEVERQEELDRLAAEAINES
eukprot:g189.t1